MIHSHCPSEAELVRFVDADLSPESSGRLSEHLGQCPSCSRQVRDLRSLVEDLGRSPAISLDVAAHLKDVMRGLDRPVAQDKRPPFLPRLAAITAIAASVGLLIHVVGSRTDSAAGAWQARGGSPRDSLSRDVGVQVYTLEKSLQPLRPGDTIAADVALTAGLRNLGQATAYVLLFAIDSQNAVHWISPKFTRADEDPSGTQLARTPEEHVLQTSVVFDDMSEGPMRIVTIVSPVVIRVSQVERLAESELAGGNLLHHFPGAEVREMAVQVRVTNRRGSQ